MIEEQIKCSDCNRPLMNIRINGHSDNTTTIKASCPFCNGFSFSKEIEGDFSFGPIGKDEPYNSTYIDDIQTENNKTLFVIGKYK